MARIWSSGFENNTISSDVEWTAFSAGVTIQQATVRTGVYAAQCNAAATTLQIRKDFYTSDQAIAGYARIYINVAAYPDTNTEILRWINSGGTTVARLRLTTTGTLVLLTGGSTSIGSASSALNLGQWYRVEMLNDATTNPGTLTLRLDGSQVATGSNSVQGQWMRIDLGVRISCTMNMFLDDFALNDTGGTAQNSWPGAGGIIHLRPNGAGDSTQWTIGGTTPASTNYGSVNEVPMDDTTTSVSTATSGKVDHYKCTPSIGANATVNVVAVGGRFSNSTADAVTAFKFDIEKAASGTVSQSSAIIPNSTTWHTNATAAPYLYPITLYADPDSSAWTQATLNTMQIGVSCSATGTNAIRVSNIWALVDFVPGTPTVLSNTHTIMGI